MTIIIGWKNYGWGIKLVAWVAQVVTSSKTDWTMVNEKDWMGTKSTVDYYLTYINHLGW